MLSVFFAKAMNLMFSPKAMYLCFAKGDEFNVLAEDDEFNVFAEGDKFNSVGWNPTWMTHTASDAAGVEFRYLKEALPKRIKSYFRVIRGKNFRKLTTKYTKHTKVYFHALSFLNWRNDFIGKAIKDRQKQTSPKTLL